MILMQKAINLTNSFSNLKKAFLVLEDKTIFEGVSFGFEKNASGEVVFNTGMTGYIQSLTDPSYKGQILCFTFPLIGNYGVPKKEKKNNLLKFFESDKIQVEGLIVSDYSFNFSHWNAFMSLQEWLKSEKIPAITNIDTRALTKKLREQGTMLGRIVFNNPNAYLNEKIFDPNKKNLAAETSNEKIIEYGKGKKTIAVIDCGIKNSIIRALIKRKVKVLRVPWNYDLTNSTERFDAVLISNGPGDPMKADKTIENIKKIFELNLPLFGICLGHQIMALASEAKTFKLKYGHRSQNQPCFIKGTKNAFITSQNHGFAVDRKSLSSEWLEWFINANDLTNEGIKHKLKPFISVQFHPEANPGPKDTEFLFDKFIKMIK